MTSSNINSAVDHFSYGGSTDSTGKSMVKGITIHSDDGASTFDSFIPFNINRIDNTKNYDDSAVLSQLIVSGSLYTATTETDLKSIFTATTGVGERVITYFHNTNKCFMKLTNATAAVAANNITVGVIYFATKNSNMEFPDLGHASTEFLDNVDPFSYDEWAESGILAYEELVFVPNTTNTVNGYGFWEPQELSHMDMLPSGVLIFIKTITSGTVYAQLFTASSGGFMYGKIETAANTAVDFTLA